MYNVIAPPAIPRKCKLVACFPPTAISTVSFCVYVCPGFGQSGQLGQGSVESIGMTEGTMGDSLLPIDLGEGRTATAVAPGGTHTCAGVCAA